MSLSEPLAWPFRPEQLEALAARIREWNGTAFTVEPACWGWSSAMGTLRRLGSEPVPPVEVEITADSQAEPPADEQPSLSQVNVDPAGAPVDVSTEATVGFVNVADDVYANSQDRNISFDSMSDAWGGGSDFSEAAGTPVAPPVAPEDIEAKQFVPAFERDDEDDSELDIKPSERARLNESGSTSPDTIQPEPVGKKSDEDDNDDEGWDV